MRQTKTHTINQHKVEIYEFATPRDIFAVRDVEGESKQTETLLERLVVSVDGTKDNVVDTVMETFSIADFQEVQDIIANLIDPKKKSGSQSSTTGTSE